ncbi:MAG: hypothetical protein AAF960_09890 [Bacteroidota bacterium]
MNLLKITYLIVTTFIFGLTLGAQELTIEDISLAEDHIIDVENGGFVVIRDIDPKKVRLGNYQAKHQFQLFNADLALVASDTVLLGGQIADNPIQAAVFNGSHYLIAFKKKGGKLALRYYDEAGQLFRAVGCPCLETGEYIKAIPKGFVHFESITKKEGLKMLMIGKNKGWINQFKPEKGRYLIRSYQQVNNLIALMLEKVGAVRTRKQQLELIIIDAHRGTILSHTELGATNKVIYPVKPLIDGQNVVLSGVYFEGKKLNYRQSSGLFLLKYATDGTLQTEQYEPWTRDYEDAIRRQTKRNQSGLKTSHLITLPLALFKTNGGYQLAGELYYNAINKKSLLSKGLKMSLSFSNKEGLSSENSNLTAGDFIFFNFDGETTPLNNLFFHEKYHAPLGGIFSEADGGANDDIFLKAMRTRMQPFDPMGADKPFLPLPTDDGNSFIFMDMEKDLDDGQVKQVTLTETGTEEAFTLDNKNLAGLVVGKKDVITYLPTTQGTIYEYQYNRKAKRMVIVKM